MIPAVHFDSLLTGSDCQKLTVQERRFSQVWLLCIKQAVWVRYRLACHKLLLQTLCQMGKITSHQKIICYVYYGNHHRKGRQPHKSLGNCLKLNKASGEFSEGFFCLLWYSRLCTRTPDCLPMKTKETRERTANWIKGKRNPTVLSGDSVLVEKKFQNKS